MWKERLNFTAHFLHSLHLFSVVCLHGMALVGPLCGEWGIPSVSIPENLIFSLPGTTIITSTSRLTHYDRLEYTSLDMPDWGRFVFSGSRGNRSLSHSIPLPYALYFQTTISLPRPSRCTCIIVTHKVYTYTRLFIRLDSDREGNSLSHWKHFSSKLKIVSKCYRNTTLLFQKLLFLARLPRHKKSYNSWTGYAITWRPSISRARFVTAGTIDPKLCTYVPLGLVRVTYRPNFGPVWFLVWPPKTQKSTMTPELMAGSSPNFYHRYI
jgi:hypothetical protein